MGMRFPVGPMRGRAKPNPWLYLTPDERLEAEREIFRTMATPGQAMDMLHYADPRNPMGAYDPIATQQNLYEQMLKNAEGQIESKVVEPLGAAGYPNLAGGIGAVGSAMTQMIPGPNEGLPFMSGGLGMAGGKVKNLWEHMTPEARKIAEEAHEKLRKEMMESSVADQAGPIDPYAPEVSAGGDRRINPYEALQEQERRTLDPDTGLPIERRQNREMRQGQFEQNREKEEWEIRQEEAAAKKAAARKNMSWRERMDDDIENEYWQSKWDDGSLDEGLWDDWYYDAYNADEVPTRGDELERIQDRLRYDSGFRDEIKEKIKGEVTDDWVDPDGGVSVTDLKDVLPDDFVDWAKKYYPDDLEEVRQNGYISNDNEHLLDEWAKEMADEYVEKKIKDYEPDADDWEWELEHMDPTEWDSDYDWNDAEYGKEKFVGEQTRKRRFRQDVTDQYIKDNFEKSVGDDIDRVYRDHVEDWDTTADEIWDWTQPDASEIDDLTALFDDPTLPADLDEWEDVDFETAFNNYFDDRLAPDAETVKDIQERLKKSEKASAPGVPRNADHRAAKSIADSIRDHRYERWDKIKKHKIDNDIEELRKLFKEYAKDLKQIKP